jgi:hypothetical protein
MLVVKMLVMVKIQMLLTMENANDVRKCWRCWKMLLTVEDAEKPYADDG